MSDTMIYGCDLIKEYAISRGILKRKEILKAVDGVTLRVNKGEVLGLVGESGCGQERASPAAEGGAGSDARMGVLDPLPCRV